MLTTLFCLPFAGGNKYSYRAYEAVQPDTLQIVPLEYPGRGARMKEAFPASMEDLIDDLFMKIRHRLQAAPYAIYGHSMGALAALLLVRKIVAAGYQSPVQVFLTGTSGPSAYFQYRKERSTMSRGDFIQEIRDLDGSPAEILEDDTLFEYFEPILRADFRIIEHYRYQPAPPLQVPLTVITGTGEKMAAEDIAAWQVESTIQVDFRQMEGKHFFIFDHAPEIVSLIADKLSLSDEIIEI